MKPITHTLLSITLLLSALHAPALAQSAPAPVAKATLEDFRWLVGAWTGHGLGGPSEEMWMPPAGGAMLGSFRHLKEGKVVFYEILTLLEREGTVVLRLKHFHPDLTGWEEKGQVLEFPLVDISPTRAVFNAMTFTHETTGAFTVRLKLRDRQTGELRDELFEYRRLTP